MMCPTFCSVSSNVSFERAPTELLHRVFSYFTAKDAYGNVTEEVFGLTLRLFLVPRSVQVSMQRLYPTAGGCVNGDGEGRSLDLRRPSTPGPGLRRRSGPQPSATASPCARRDLNCAVVFPTCMPVEGAPFVSSFPP